MSMIIITAIVFIILVSGGILTNYMRKEKKIFTLLLLGLGVPVLGIVGGIHYFWFPWGCFMFGYITTFFMIRQRKQEKKKIKIQEDNEKKGKLYQGFLKNEKDGSIRFVTFKVLDGGVA